MDLIEEGFVVRERPFLRSAVFVVPSGHGVGIAVVVFNNLVLCGGSEDEGAVFFVLIFSK